MVIFLVPGWGQWWYRDPLSDFFVPWRQGIAPEAGEFCQICGVCDLVPRKRVGGPNKNAPFRTKVSQEFRSPFRKFFFFGCLFACISTKSGLNVAQIGLACSLTDA